MAPSQPLPDIPEFGKIESGKSIQPERTTIPDTKTFESLMKGEEAAETKGQISPMELAKEQMATSPTADSLLSQVNSTQNQINDIKDKLNTPNLNLKNSHQKLLNSKISEANDHLQKANEYLGTEEITPSQIPENATPITKFLSYLTDGQDRLLMAQQRLKEISSKKEQLQPSEMMLIQINLAQAQQEIEFSSVLLGRVTDALKQTLSIQL